MEASTTPGMALSELVRAEEQGLDLNRLLFVKYLIVSKRLTDDCDFEETPEQDALVAA